MIKQNIQSNTRQSGIELLRLIVMLMVLMLHANFLSFGIPSAEDTHTDPISSIGRIFAEHICIVAVNVYVFISGWFGIHPKIKSIVNLLLEVFTYSALGLLVCFLFDRTTLSLGIISEILLIGKPYWFVVSYLLLCILSPVLNTFIEQSKPSTVKMLLISFFSFEAIYGYIFGQGGFGDGYSTMSFIGIYLSARHLRVNGSKILQLSKVACISIYVFISMIMTLIVTIQLYFLGHVAIGDYLITYDNPLVIMSSLFLFLAFTQFNFRNYILNYLASSAFAVYLIHINPHICPYYKNMIICLYESFEGCLGVLIIIVFGLLVMFSCIIIDKIRIAITPSSIVHSICEKITGKIICKIADTPN